MHRPAIQLDLPVSLADAVALQEELPGLRDRLERSNRFEQEWFAAMLAAERRIKTLEQQLRASQIANAALTLDTLWLRTQLQAAQETTFPIVDVPRLDRDLLKLVHPDKRSGHCDILMCCLPRPQDGGNQP